MMMLKIPPDFDKAEIHGVSDKCFINGVNRGHPRFSILRRRERTSIKMLRTHIVNVVGIHYMR
jgi:hypothetical protein